jgi:hypothetical protein
MQEKVNIGDYTKVHLRGETPWVKVLMVGEHNLILGEINNHLVGNLHSYKFGDIETFHLVDYGYATCWEPSPHRKLDLHPIPEDKPPMPSFKSLSHFNIAGRGLVHCVDLKDIDVSVGEEVIIDDVSYIIRGIEKQGFKSTGGLLVKEIKESSHVIPLGEAVEGECYCKTEYCRYPIVNQIGACLKYNDCKTGLIMCVCKNCADYLYKEGIWIRD